MDRPCIGCGKPSTRSLTPDPDIEGIPICDDPMCLVVAYRELFVAISKQVRDEEDLR